MRLSEPPDDETLGGALAPVHDGETLVDLLDRVIERGVVIAGDVVLSVAGVDLVHLELHLRLQGVAADVTSRPAGGSRLVDRT